jgi:hypothetical protein
MRLTVSSITAHYAKRGVEQDREALFNEGGAPKAIQGMLYIRYG